MTPAQQTRGRGSFRGTFPGKDARGSSSGFVIPFDHAASFELQGIPGNIVQDVINISTDGAFVAVSIGYGFEEDRGRPAGLVPLPTKPISPGGIKLGQIPTAALIEGFRLNPSFDRIVFEAGDPSTRASQFSVPKATALTTKPIAPEYGRDIIQRLKPAEEISFLFSIVDTATGRELQDEPTHNLASLGISNGERPFRLLAQPLAFQPRSTLRLQIVERSEGVQGTLFIVLYGYKILGSSACPEPVLRTLRGSPACLTETIGSPSARVIPFDYVTSFQLTGLPGNQVDAEAPINVEGGFVATSIGYGLAAENLDVTIRGMSDASPVSLGGLTLSQFPITALQDGVRIRPSFVRIAFDNNGGLATVQSSALANRVFERLNRPEDVSFRYSILDTGTGRELQNQPINNVAGLGIANGDRPFKRLARAMLFLPRSTIRVTVEERFGRGTLFIVFQGYKILGEPSVTEVSALRRSVRPR